MSLEQCIFPKMAELVPVFKKDDKIIKNNFRPVIVLPCISKVFEHVYCNQMMTFLMKFCPNFSCILEGLHIWDRLSNGWRMKESTVLS